jgi:hypothetical protein
MRAMVVAGRAASRMDSRSMIAAGTLLLCWSMSLLAGSGGRVNAGVNTIIQGAGMGCIFVPPNVVAFATLPVRAVGW